MVEKRKGRRLEIRPGGALLLGVLLLACDTVTDPYETLLSPQQTGDGWATASPGSVGMDPAPLLELLRHIGGVPGHRLHGLLIARNGKLVLEEYWPGADMVPDSLTLVERDFGRDTLHYLASVSKSLASVLVGMASDQGLLPDLDEPVFSFFPEQASLKSAANEGITLRHLLTFTSGYDWNEHSWGYDDPGNSIYQMFRAPDPMAYLLGRPVLTSPGSVFRYNSGDTNLAGEIVRRVTGSSTLLDYAERQLFGPLGIERYAWFRFPRAPQVAFASGGVSLRPRDMAKMGALFLDGGTWNGTRVLSTSWVEASTRRAVAAPGTFRTADGYGFNWWLGRSRRGAGSVDYFRAAGWGEQHILVYPELSLVVVFTGGAYYAPLGLDLDELLEEYILRSVGD